MTIENLNTASELNGSYGVFKAVIVIVGMWLAANLSACGLSVGGPAGTVLGSTSYMKEVNKGAIALKDKELSAKRKGFVK